MADKKEELARLELTVTFDGDCSIHDIAEAVERIKDVANENGKAKGVVHYAAHTETV